MARKNIKNKIKDLRTWIEVDTHALENNFRVLERLLGSKTKFMAVVKSNAYGHNIYDFALKSVSRGADWFGVDSVVEAKTLRERGIKKPILILGHTLPKRLLDAANFDSAATIPNFEGLLSLSKMPKGKTPKIHIKVDTGMHRQGFSPEEIPQVIKFIKNKLPNLEVQGLYTHFAAAKNPSFPNDTRKQISEFLSAKNLFFEAGFGPICHTAATSGAILYPEAHFDMVRFGIGLYGLWPSPEVRAFAEDRIKLKPILSWRAVVCEVKSIGKGERIGYDFTETLYKNSKIAIIPVGYWHGFPRSLSSVGRVLVRGKRVRVIGRVSMDMIAVDVSGIKNVRVGDVATLIGRDGQEEITADEVAGLAGTINYEIVTQLNPLIERVYN